MEELASLGFISVIPAILAIVLSFATNNTIVALAIAAPALKDYFLLQRRKRAALSERRRGAC